MNSLIDWTAVHTFMEANFVTHNTARWNLLSNSVGKVHISSILWFPPGASGEMVSIRPIVSGKKKSVYSLENWNFSFWNLVIYKGLKKTGLMKHKRYPPSSHRIFKVNLDKWSTQDDHNFLTKKANFTNQTVLKLCSKICVIISLFKP